MLKPNWMNENYYLGYTRNEQAADTSLMRLKSINYSNWHCVLNRTKGIEPCGRKWTSVSPLEYAAWIGDMFMVKMLLDHVAQEGKVQALAQLINVRDMGLENGPRMAPFLALIDAYEHYESRYTTNEYYTERDRYVGRKLCWKQYELSYFGLQWLCDDQPFYPNLPAFDRAPRRSFILDGKPWEPINQNWLGFSFIKSAKERNCEFRVEVGYFIGSGPRKGASVPSEHLNIYIKRPAPIGSSHYFVAAIYNS